jgi:hypothetical protein
VACSRCMEWLLVMVSEGSNGCLWYGNRNIYCFSNQTGKLEHLMTVSVLHVCVVCAIMLSCVDIAFE